MLIKTFWFVLLGALGVTKLGMAITTSEKRLGPYLDRKGMQIFAKILTPPYAFTEEAVAFGIVFKQVNAGYTTEELGTDNLESMYQNTFAQEIKDFGKPGVYYIRLETGSEDLIGYISIEALDVMVPGKYPPHSVYWRHIFVMPVFQRRGIADIVLTNLVKTLIPKVEHMYVMTRRINKVAINFYKKHTFIEGKEIFHGWDPKKFISLEWHKP